MKLTKEQLKNTMRGYIQQLEGKLERADEWLESRRGEQLDPLAGYMIAKPLRHFNRKKRAKLERLTLKDFNLRPLFCTLCCKWYYPGETCSCEPDYMFSE